MHLSRFFNCLIGVKYEEITSEGGTNSYMQITEIRKAFSLKDSHCAFTDIICFHNTYYLGFMLGVEHRVNKENKSVVLKSKDGINFTQSALFYCGIDTREPKFMVLGDRLFAYFFTIHPSPDQTRMITDSWFSFTEDGMTWSQPERFATEVKFWRPVSHKGIAYCVTHPKDPSPEGCCRLMRSEDGIHWSELSQIPIDPTEKPNEASIAFDENDILHVFIRSDRGKLSAYYLKSHSPYTSFEVFDLGRRMGGPLIWIDDGKVYIGSRFYTGSNIPHTGIFTINDSAEAELITVLPSMGDSSYMGITKRYDGNGYLVSYYSSHESLNGDLFSNNVASVYVAELTKDIC